MISVIMAAGYATRLYPLTENFPKPLLKIGSSTILDRLVDDLDTVPGISRHILVTNHRFAPIFRQWADGRRGAVPVDIIDDGTTDNDSRLGAVGDLLLALTSRRVDDDVMVLAADNILDFSLRGFADYFRLKGTSVIMRHREPRTERLRRTGVVAVDPDDRVTLMQEKPADPVSQWAVPPFYIYSRADLPLILGAPAAGCPGDAPGSLARHLVPLTAVHAWPMPGARHDIGSLDSYREACEMFG